MDNNGQQACCEIQDDPDSADAFFRRLNEAIQRTANNLAACGGGISRFPTSPYED